MSQAANRLYRWFHGALRIWHHAEYRLPLTTLEARTGAQPRRADFVLETLLDLGVVGEGDVRGPERVSYEEILRVHDAAYVERLTTAAALAEVLSVDAWDVPVDEVMATFRRACGGTLAAAKEALARKGPTLNLLGGFHHAGASKGGGFCAINDIAIAVAVLRAEGFSGSVAVLDLDAHPPDGLAACLAGQAWIGSVSGADWGPLAGVDETVLAPGSGDVLYVSALDSLLARMPSAGLTFVIAGGDVLASDPLGNLGLTLAGVRERDARVARALSGRPSVWLPGGGYRPDSWRVLVGTALVLAGRAGVEIAPDYDPLAHQFGRVYRRRATPPENFTLDTADIEESLGMARRDPRLLGFYTTEAIELALTEYGLLGPVRRLGYGPFRVDVDVVDAGDRMRLWGQAEGAEHLLVEAVYERRITAGKPVLFVHWMTLRHPLGAFHAGRPQLPGQDVPGLGMAREAGEMLARMATRLGLAGVVFVPAWYHVAWQARHRMQFVEPAAQAHFSALAEATKGMALLDASRAIAAGKVSVNGTVARWEPAEMVEWVG